MVRLVLETPCWLQMGAQPDGMEEGPLGSCGPHWGWDAEGRHGGLGTAKSLQSCPTLCDPADGNPPGSPVPGILQARILGWVAISFSRGTSQTRD